MQRPTQIDIDPVDAVNAYLKQSEPKPFDVLPRALDLPTQASHCELCDAPVALYVPDGA